MIRFRKKGKGTRKSENKNNNNNIENNVHLSSTPAILNSLGTESLSEKRPKSAPNKHLKFRFNCRPVDSVAIRIGFTPLKEKQISQEDRKIAGNYSEKISYTAEDGKLPEYVTTTTPSRRRFEPANTALEIATNNGRRRKMNVYIPVSTTPVSESGKQQPPTPNLPRRSVRRSLNLHALPSTPQSGEKLIGPVNIDLSTLQKSLRQEQGRSQNQEMGNNSATELARKLNLLIDPCGRCEWLHLVAKMFGGNGVNPQIARNLVGGSKECNTDMMTIEMVIRRLLEEKSVTSIQVQVKATLIKNIDPDLAADHTPFAQKIEYKMLIGDTEFSMNFDTSNRHRPHIVREEYLMNTIRPYIPIAS